MRGGIDFSSWPAALSTLFGLVLVSLVAVGVRLVFMQTLQRRRERLNRQINERLRTLMAAYKTLGSSFTGELGVDPAHLREQRLRAAAGEAADAAPPSGGGDSNAERRRRIRDAVEGALADVILLGTEEQVRLAAAAARDMVAGRTVHTAELVASLRAFIRDALDLAPIGADVVVPAQGPQRVAGSGSRGATGGREGAGGRAGGAGGAGGGGAGGGAGGMGMGMGMAAGGIGAHHAATAGAEADEGAR